MQPQQEETFQLEAYSQNMMGQICIVLEKPHEGWMPYEFLPTTIKTRILVSGLDKTIILSDNWKYILQNPTLQDWSVFCSIIKHVPSPSMLYITSDVQIPQQALTFLQKAVHSIGATVIIERTAEQMASVNVNMMNSMFLPGVTHKNIQKWTPLYKHILTQIPSFKNLDHEALLQQISYSNLGLILAKDDSGRFSVYWYKPDESKAVDISKENMAGWLRSFASLLDSA
jgi:hypothetical protein